MMKLILITATVLLVGCTSSIQNRYSPFIIGDSSLSHIERLKPGEEPKIYTSLDMRLDSLILRSRHLQLIGILKLRGKGEDASSIRALAKEVGATAVLVDPKFIYENSLTMPPVYHGGTAIYYSKHIEKWYTESVGDGGKALFFAINIQKVRVGVGLRNMPQDPRKPHTRQNGAIIDIILEDSPAFSSNLRPGDILVKVNGEEVIDGTHAQELINKVDPLSTSLTLTVIRDEKTANETISFYKL